MTFEQRQELRAKISDARRAHLINPCPRGYGSETGYRYYGCRCRSCVQATSDARLARKKAARLAAVARAGVVT